MDTLRQNVLRSFNSHAESCYLCCQNLALRCKTARAFVTVYNGDFGHTEYQFGEITRMHWDVLALASLQADDDKDLTWAIRLDAVISQRVEFIWAMSEVHWLYMEGIRASHRH